MEKRLGSGLDILFKKGQENKIQNLKLSDIVLPKWQPRKEFEEEALQELAQSIKRHGIIQPIIVKKKDSH